MISDVTDVGDVTTLDNREIAGDIRRHVQGAKVARDDVPRQLAEARFEDYKSLAAGNPSFSSGGGLLLDPACRLAPQDVTGRAHQPSLPAVAVHPGKLSAGAAGPGWQLRDRRRVSAGDVDDLGMARRDSNQGDSITGDAQCGSGQGGLGRSALWGPDRCRFSASSGGARPEACTLSDASPG